MPPCILSLAALLTLLPPLTTPLDEREPSADVPAHTPFTWPSKGGLRFTWCVPANYDGKAKRNLTVILHGTGLDHRWGFANAKAGVFRPDDVVVSVDGTSPGQGESRLFLGKPEDAEAFRTFLHEMRERFAIDRVFLYGHSQGGFFVVYFAGEFPREVSGVVAHASGAWNWSKTGKDVRDVPIAFLHGTADPVVPYRQSTGARDEYAKRGFDSLLLRRMERYNHWPNQVRATECLDWCEGMTTQDPERALELAQRLAAPKGVDEYRYEIAPAFAASRAVLARLEGKNAFEEVLPSQQARARKMIDLLEREGERHVAALRQALGKTRKLTLQEGSWLGHLISLREDFRGIASVETFVDKLKFDATLAKQDKAVEAILKAWYEEKDSSKILGTVLQQLPNAFLFEGFPSDFVQKMDEWKTGLTKPSRAVAKQLEAYEAWKTSWNAGLDAYRATCKEWKGFP
ncbi:MAG: alpha/beta fold hydrolase [Planctomycetes bacterium]|nr:alpha/beta fold hydrolase [Planctomycetota bacterium]